MNVIQEITTQTSRGTNETANSIGKLAELAGDLQKSIAGFQYESGFSDPGRTGNEHHFFATPADIHADICSAFCNFNAAIHCCVCKSSRSRAGSGRKSDLAIEVAIVLLLQIVVFS